MTPGDHELDGQFIKFDRIKVICECRHAFHNYERCSKCGVDRDDWMRYRDHYRGWYQEQTGGKEGQLMNYPTMEQVEAADRMQICRWYRFLKSPGERAIGTEAFEGVLVAETTIMGLIEERFVGLGGMMPEISKALGWGD